MNGQRLLPFTLDGNSKLASTFLAVPESGTVIHYGRLSPLKTDVFSAPAAGNHWRSLSLERRQENKQDGACIAHRPGPVSALRFLTVSAMPTEVGHG